MPNTLPALKRQLLTGSPSYTIAEAKKYVADVLACEREEADPTFEKRFFHEFIPLVTIAAHIDDTNCLISFAGSSDKIDGCLDFGCAQQLVELTAAVDGHNDALRMELHKKRGWAPATGKIQATGSKRDREFGANLISFRSSGTYNGELLRLMRTALEKKKERAPSRPDYHGAWLGIVIENYPPGAYQKKHCFDPLCVQLLSGPGGYAPFTRAFVVSAVGDYLFDSASIIPLLAPEG